MAAERRGGEEQQEARVERREAGVKRQEATKTVKELVEEKGREGLLSPVPQLVAGRGRGRGRDRYRYPERGRGDCTIERHE